MVALTEAKLGLHHYVYVVSGYASDMVEHGARSGTAPLRGNAECNGVASHPLSHVIRVSLDAPGDLRVEGTKSEAKLAQG